MLRASCQKYTTQQKGEYTVAYSPNFSFTIYKCKLNAVQTPYLLDSHDFILENRGQKQNGFPYLTDKLALSDTGLSPPLGQNSHKSH